MVVARYSADGAPDPSFGNGGVVMVNIGGSGASGNGLALQLDDKILIGGKPLEGSWEDFGVARLNSDGSIDTTFGLAGKVETDIGGATDDLKSLLVQPDGGILAVGTGWSDSTSNEFIELARYRSDGSLDTSFGDGGKKMIAFGPSDQAFDAVMTPDGKILIAGFHQAGNDTNSMLLRLNPNGSVDTTFGVNGMAMAGISNNYDSFYSLAIQADGNIVACGGAEGDTTVARFLPNGTLDSSFGAGGKLNTSVTNSSDNALAVVVQHDGKIVLGGAGTTTDPNANPKVESTLLRFGNAPEQAPPTLDPASDDGTPGDGVTTQTSLAFALQPQDPFFHFFRDDQQIAGGYQAGTAYTAVNQPAGTHAYGFKAVDRAGNESSLSRTTTITINTVATAASVVSHKLFYNNSKFDGGSAAPGNVDDGAIATDKVPLLAGAGRATFANVSNYDKGINGVMLDIAGLPAGAGPTTSDFDVALSTDGANWNAGPAPTSVTTRRQQGTAQSDRVTLIWPDGSIKDKWLRLTAKVTSVTGLPSADVSYFGSAVGDTGNGLATDAIVNIDSSDYYGVRDHLRSYDNPAPVTWNWDLNRDGITDIADIMLVRSSATTSSTALQLITISQPPTPLIAGGSVQATKEADAIEAAPIVKAATSTRTARTITAIRTRVGWRPLTR